METQTDMLETETAEENVFSTAITNIRAKDSETRKKLQKLEEKANVFSRETTIVTLNLSGYRYQMMKESFLKLPIKAQIISKSILLRSKDSDAVEYFVESSEPSCFLAVIHYFRSGKLHIPKNVCKNMFKKEIECWDIDCRELCTSCYLEYASFNQEQDSGKEFFRKRRTQNYHQIVSKMAKWQKMIYLLTYVPQSSWKAYIYNLIFIFAIFASILVSVALTSNELPYRVELNEKQWREYFKDNMTELHYLCTLKTHEQSEQLRNFCENNKDFFTTSETSNQHCRHRI